MSLDAYLGEVLPLQILYVDAEGAPLTQEPTPTVTVLRWDPVSGEKETLVAGVSMVWQGAGDPGRYVYLFLVPATLDPGQVLWVEYRAQDPGSPVVKVSTETVNVHARSLKVQFFA